MIKLLALSALLAAQPAASPAGAPPGCLPKEKVGDVAMVLAPFVVDALARHCTPHLPPQAYLAAGGATLAQRLRTDSADRVGSAAETLQRIMGAGMPPMQDQQALLQVIGEMGTGFMVRNLRPANCPEVSAMIEAVAPLPTRNLGIFVSSFAGIVGREQAAASAKAAAKADETKSGATTVEVKIAPADGKAEKPGARGAMDFKICQDG
jgi:hypothetical protein